MAADGEAVDHEALLVEEQGDDLLHHHPVGGREGVLAVQKLGGDDVLRLQSLAHGDVVIAHVGVGEVPVVVVVKVVMEGHGGIALLTEQIAQAEGHIVFC